MTNNYLNLDELVRSIQRSSGDPDCFRRGLEPCDKADCMWRTLCQDLAETPDINEIKVINHK